MRAHILAVVLLCLMTGADAAGQPASRLDRLVAAFDAPSMDFASAVARLAAQEGFNLGAEYAPEEIAKAPYHPPSAPQVKVGLSARGKTVREILDALAAQDPAHRYLVDDRWINIVPAARVDDPDYFMNWRIPGTVTLSTEDTVYPPAVQKWMRDKRISFLYVYMGLSMSVGLSGHARERPVAPETVTLQNPSLREFLNTVHRLQGHSKWTVAPLWLSSSSGPRYVWTEGWGILRPPSEAGRVGLTPNATPLPRK